MRQRNWITRPRRSQHHAHVMDFWNHKALVKERHLLDIAHGRYKPEEVPEEEKQRLFKIKAKA